MSGYAGLPAAGDTQPRVRVGVVRSARSLDELVADVRREPVVAVEERVRVDELVRGPDDVELLPSVDLADVARLRDVVVVAVERDRALRCVERDGLRLGRGVHLVDV